MCSWHADNAAQEVNCAGQAFATCWLLSSQQQHDWHQPQLLRVLALPQLPWLPLF